MYVNIDTFYFRSVHSLKHTSAKGQCFSTYGPFEERRESYGRSPMEPWSFPVSTKFGATMIAIHLAFDQWHHLGLENPPFQIRFNVVIPIN